MSQDPLEVPEGRSSPDSVLFSPAPLLGSRTPIRFGEGIAQVLGLDLPEYTEIFQEVTTEFLLYGYRRQVRDQEYLFLLVQGSRFAGRLVTEVGISRRPEFPYFRHSDLPRLAVAGVRERVPLLLSGEDHSFRYSSQEDLVRVLREVAVGLTSSAIRSLHEQASGYLLQEQLVWGRLYQELGGGAPSAGAGGFTVPFHDLVHEQEARELFTEILLSGRFDRIMGPLKFRYRDPRFRDAHLYLFGRALEFLDPPELTEEELSLSAPPAAEEETSKPRMITWADILGPAPRLESEEEQLRKRQRPEPLADAVAGVSGRQPQRVALELSLDPTRRQQEFSFLKSLAALEAYWEELSP